MSKVPKNQGLAREKDYKSAPVARSDFVSASFEKSFDTEKVLRLLGARKGRRVSTASLRRIDAMSEKLQEMLKPQLGYRILRISAVDPGGIRLADGTRFKSPKLARSLRHAREVCCFLSTVGPVVDLEIQRLMQLRRYSDAYILDAMGSMSVENVVEQFYRRMARRQEKEGAGVSLRFSPGYCDWPLKEQYPLFKLFEDINRPAVTLSDSCLMSPSKSVSGLFGLLPPGIQGVNPAYNPCNTCRQHECIARRSN